MIERAAPMMSYDAHAMQARFKARSLGLHDCIHYAPEWRSRADALYTIANEAYDQHGVCWFKNGGGSPFLLEDGRMVIVCDGIWFVELKGV